MHNIYPAFQLIIKKPNCIYFLNYNITFNVKRVVFILA